MKIIVTNNPMVRDMVPVPGYEPVEYHDTDYLGVLKVVRDRIHLGSVLLTHPLSGSVKPGQTPFKTVLISCVESDGEQKMLSLSIIENSIQTCMKFMVNGIKRNWSAKTLADFQLIDYNLVFG